MSDWQAAVLTYAAAGVGWWALWRWLGDDRD